ncbi:MAG: hypothetical protein ACRCZW_09340 [Lactobacillaceae bacterium]
MMILYFVFGGEDCIKEDKDVQKNVGQHTINFVFEFNEKIITSPDQPKISKMLMLAMKILNH